MTPDDLFQTHVGHAVGEVAFKAQRPQLRQPAQGFQVRNFPQDYGWVHGSLLAGVAAAQWSGVFRIGQYWLRHTRKSRRSAFDLSLGVTLVTFATPLCCTLDPNGKALVTGCRRPAVRRIGPAFPPPSV